MKIVAQNKRATFDLEIVDTVEAGMMLTGQEAKSCRAGHANLAGAYVSFLHGKAVLKQAKIAKYAFASGLESYDPARDRELLLSKRERDKLETMVSEKGMAIVPLEMRAGMYIKLLLGVGKGRKKIDKRQRIKDREMDRRVRQGREI